jgi:hypothetical protein
MQDIEQKFNTILIEVCGIRLFQINTCLSFLFGKGRPTISIIFRRRGNVCQAYLEDRIVYMYLCHTYFWPGVQDVNAPLRTRQFNAIEDALFKAS